MLKLFPFYFEEVTDPADPPSDGGGTLTTDPPADWRSSLPEDLRDNPSLKDVKDVGSLAKSYLHAQKAIGNNVAVPSKDATEEEWGAFFNKVGRPESADKYDFSKVDGLDKVAMSEDQQKSFMSEAHRLGLSQRQAAGLLGYYGKISAESLESQEKAMQEYQQSAMEELKKEFGNAYNDRLAMAKEAAKKFGGEDAIEKLEEAGLGDNPLLIKMLANVGRAMENDELFGAGGEVKSGKLTPAEAREKIEALRSNADYMKAYMNGDLEKEKELRMLYTLANPE